MLPYRHPAIKRERHIACKVFKTMSHDRSSPLMVTLLLACVSASCGSDSSFTSGADDGELKSVVPEGATWQLVMKDEFDGAAGSPPSGIWAAEIGSGWGNEQLEHDTDRPENVSLDGQGHLVFTARKEQLGDQDYTSARITTEGRFSRTHGRIEARIKMPRGKGLWPAFWLLGEDHKSAGWPGCGEIDVMEFRGQNLHEFRGSLHGPGYAGGQNLGRDYEVPEDLASDFHVYGVEWTELGIAFTLDGEPYYSKLAADMGIQTPWVFDDRRFFMILNLAVGGTYVGDVGDDVEFPQQMLVDYVRVYELKP
jgi:beta-glucanase (GH16 family)